MVRDTGFEPVTPSVSGRCSTTELTALEILSPVALRKCPNGSEWFNRFKDEGEPDDVQAEKFGFYRSPLRRGCTKSNRDQREEEHPFSPSRDAIHHRSDGLPASQPRASRSKRGKAPSVPMVRADLKQPTTTIEKRTIAQQLTHWRQVINMHKLCRDSRIL